MPKITPENRLEKYRQEIVELKATLLRVTGEFQVLSRKFEEATLELATLRNKFNQVPEAECDRDQSNQV